MSVAQKVYNEVMMLDNFTCVYCGYRGADIAVDHFIPRSKGGTDIVQNLVACCTSCNSRKGSNAPYEAKMLLQFGRYSYMRAVILDTTPGKSFDGMSNLMSSTPTPKERNMIREWYAAGDQGMRSLARRLYIARGGTQSYDGAGAPYYAIRTSLLDD